MDFPAQKSAGRQHNCGRVKLKACRCTTTCNSIVFQQQIVHCPLENCQIFTLFNGFTDKSPIQVAVTLCPGGADCRSFAGIESSKLDSSRISRAGHHTAHRVNFLDQVTFPDTSDCWIATHLPDGLDAVRDQQGARTASSRSKCRLGAGMAATDHDDIKVFGITHRLNYWRCRVEILLESTLPRPAEPAWVDGRLNLAGLLALIRGAGATTLCTFLPRLTRSRLTGDPGKAPLPAAGGNAGLTTILPSPGYR